MEKPIYPSPYMRITQGYNEGTHVDSFALDEAGMDSGCALHGNVAPRHGGS